MLGVFLSCSPLYFLRQCFSLNMAFSNWQAWPSSELGSSCLCPIPESLELYQSLGFYVCDENPNSGPHDFTVNCFCVDVCFQQLTPTQCLIIALSCNLHPKSEIQAHELTHPKCTTFGIILAETNTPTYPRSVRPWNQE